jgi:hypothetical protein
MSEFGSSVRLDHFLSASAGIIVLQQQAVAKPDPSGRLNQVQKRRDKAVLIRTIGNKKIVLSPSRMEDLIRIAKNDKRIITSTSIPISSVFKTKNIV